MLTRKGRLRCDSCGRKQRKRLDGFFALAHWDCGEGSTFDPVEPVNMALAEHFCSWRCVAHHAITEAISDTTPADIIGD